MLFNYLTIAWRTIAKNKIYSGINIVGLAIGMAGFILIGTWIWNEKSFDQFHENKNTLYKVWNRTTGAENVQAWDVTAGPLGKALKNDFAEIKNTSRIYWSMDRLFNYGNKTLKAKGNELVINFILIAYYPELYGSEQSLSSSVHKNESSTYL